MKEVVSGTLGKRRGYSGRAISHIHQGGQRQSSRAEPTLANSQRQAQWREDHQAKPHHSCCNPGCFLPGRIRATILLPPLTVSHHQRDQQLGQNPNKWKTVLPPHHSFILLLSIVHLSFLSLSFSLSPSSFPLSPPLVSSLPPLWSLSSALHLLSIPVHSCIMPLHLFRHLSQSPRVLGTS